jgi:hypothetical protein
MLTPDIIWYTLVSELVQIVRDDPDTYRSLFTNKPDGKTEIVVINEDSLTLMPMDKLSGELRNYIPNGLIDSFLLMFTTSTERSSWAIQTAFADLVSPYYDYSMKVCGIPSVRLEGSEEDWWKIQTVYSYVSAQLSDICNDNDDYFHNVLRILSDIKYVRYGEKNPKEFFSKMFYLELCGSGSDEEVRGWFSDLFWKQSSLRKLQNFSSHVAVVNYKQLDTGKQYAMKNGLFQSKLVNGEALPDFAYIVYEKGEEKSETFKEDIYAGIVTVYTPKNNVKQENINIDVYENTNTEGGESVKVVNPRIFYATNTFMSDTLEDIKKWDKDV